MTLRFIKEKKKRKKKKFKAEIFNNIIILEIFRYYLDTIIENYFYMFYFIVLLAEVKEMK